VAQHRVLDGIEAVLYFSDFESDNGGMTGSLDWEWGEYIWDNSTCDSPSEYPPPTAYSGSRMWGTVLNSCYGNLGATSILRFDVDLSTAATSILSWWDWYDVFGAFDYGVVYVNDSVVYDRTTSYVVPTDWEYHEVDLTPFVGGMATIEFRMYASTVVNKAGWYVDDVLVSDNATGEECVTDDDCEGETPVCELASNVCVQCVSDGDCAEGWTCEENVCISPCELIVKHKRIRSEKLTKPRRIALRISSEDEFFDIFGLIDIEPLAWDKVKFNQKKNRMIIRAIVPFMLAPGVYPISVGDCFGEFVVE
jgi:Cys-rich repeat protein